MSAFSKAEEEVVRQLVKKAILASGLKTQRAFAIQHQISKTWLSSFLNGRNAATLTPDQLNRFAKAIGMTEQELIDAIRSNTGSSENN